MPRHIRLLIELPYSAPVAVAIALAPAGLRLWWGRALVSGVDDPLFAERLAAYRVRGGQSFGVAFALLLVLATGTLLWSTPLLALSCMVANFRFRRVIFQERWGLGAYLSFVLRLVVAVFGFWVLLAALPALASYAAPYDWFVAISLAIVLLLWNAGYPELFRLVARATPIEDSALVEKFVALAQRSSARMPLFEQVRLGGGSIANAIALPSVRRSSVIFTDSLLARLDEKEIVAICGHEIAHLEHFTPRYLGQCNIGNLLLIGASLATVGVARALGSTWLSISMVWPCVVVVVMGWRARHRQQHETDSDLRAVELTGDPDSLASALTKIHAYAHIPRRVDAELEQHASHPSLARRIKAIRNMQPGVKPAATTNPIFAGADGHVQVTFGDERLEWREGEAALHSLAYARLTELRVQASSSGQPRLLVVEKGGRRWEMPLASDDVARAQGVLDLVDIQLGEPSKAGNVWPAAQRIVTFMAISASILSGQLATMIVALIAMMRPSAPLMAAAGAAMVAGAGLSLRQPDWYGLDLRLLPIALLGVGGFLLWSAWKTRACDTNATSARLVAALGILGALALIAVFGSGTNIVRAHQSARMLPGAVVWPAAFAAALACYASLRARVAAAASVAVAVAMAVLGSIPFLDRFGSDPLLLPADAMARVEISSPPSAEFDLPFYAMDVRLSPGGVYVAAHDIHRNRVRDTEPQSFEVGRLGSHFTSIAADEVQFVDDESLVTVREDDEGTEIDRRSATAVAVPVWRQRVPGLFHAKLTLDRQSDRWTLLGWDQDGRIMRARGAIGAPEFDTTRWPSPVERKIWAMEVAVSEDDALVVETQYDLGGLDMLSVRTLAAVLNPGATVSRLWKIDRNGQKTLGTSNISATCSAGVISDRHLVCSAYDGTRTRILALDSATGERTAIGVFTGRFAGDEHPTAGWLTGWQDSTPVALRLHSRQIVTLPQQQYALVGIAASDRWLAAVNADGARSRIRLFPLPL